MTMSTWGVASQESLDLTRVAFVFRRPLRQRLVTFVSGNLHTAFVGAVRLLGTALDAARDGSSLEMSGAERFSWNGLAGMLGGCSEGCQACCGFRHRVLAQQPSLTSAPPGLPPVPFTKSARARGHGSRYADYQEPALRYRGVASLACADTRSLHR